MYCLILTMISGFKFLSVTLCKLSRRFIMYPLLQSVSLVFLKVELVTKNTCSLI